MDVHARWLHAQGQPQSTTSRPRPSMSLPCQHVTHHAPPTSTLSSKCQAEWHPNLDTSPFQDHSRASKPGTHDVSATNHRLPRFKYTYSNCPAHVIVCIKGSYSQLAFKCFFCLRDSLGVIYQCGNCGTYICGSCKESERKFSWTRGKDPEYFGR